MDIKDILLTILSLVALGSGIWTFIAQKTFEHRLNKSLTRFTKIFSDQVDTIKEFYKLLVKAEKALTLLMSQREPTEPEKKKEFLSETILIINNMIKYFEENELLFEKDTTSEIKDIIKKIEEAKLLQGTAEFLESERGSEQWSKAVNEKQSYFENTVKQEFPVLREKLKRDFQKKYHLISN
jgi:glutamyl/glutaminyl-tRNA synthetase